MAFVRPKGEGKLILSSHEGTKKRERDQLRQERNQQEIEKEKLRNTFLVKREKWCRDDIRAMHCFNFVSMAVWFGISSTSQREKRRAVNRDPPPPYFPFQNSTKTSVQWILFTVCVCLCVCVWISLSSGFLFSISLSSPSHTFSCALLVDCEPGKLKITELRGWERIFYSPPPRVAGITRWLLLVYSASAQDERHVKRRTHTHENQSFWRLLTSRKVTRLPFFFLSLPAFSSFSSFSLSIRQSSPPPSLPLLLVVNITS